MESKDLLNELDADRTALAERVRTPWWLPAGFGLMAACFVASPAFEGNTNGVIIASIVLTFALLATYRAATGVKLARLGPLPWVMLIVALVLVLGLFSVALGLASLNLQWWITLPAVVAFATGAALTFLFTNVARKRMRHVG